MHLVRLMKRSTFDPESIYSRNSRLLQSWRSTQSFQIQSVELNWVKRRTSHELNSPLLQCERPQTRCALWVWKWCRDVLCQRLVQNSAWRDCSDWHPNFSVFLAWRWRDFLCVLKPTTGLGCNDLFARPIFSTCVILQDLVAQCYLGKGKVSGDVCNFRKDKISCCELLFTYV